MNIPRRILLWVGVVVGFLLSLYVFKTSYLGSGTYSELGITSWVTSFLFSPIFLIPIFLFACLFFRWYYFVGITIALGVLEGVSLQGSVYGGPEMVIFPLIPGFLVQIIVSAYRRRNNQTSVSVADPTPQNLIAPEKKWYRKIDNVIGITLIVLGVFISFAHDAQYWPFATSQQTKIDTFVKGLGSQDNHTVAVAMDRLGVLFRTSPDPIIAREIAPQVIFKLNSSDTTILYSAVRLLGVLRDKQAIDPLLKVLENPGQDFIRTSAADSLGQIGGDRAVLGLINIMSMTSDEYLGMKIANALSLTGDARAISVIRLLHDRTTDSYVKSETQKVLDALSH